MSNTMNHSLQCYHCGDDCNHTPYIINEKHFCCKGCKMVYEILNQNDLCQYYDLNNTPGLSQKIEIRKGKFNFLDEKSIQEKLISFTDDKVTNVSLYLPQMHCSSCLWLLENLHKINQGVINSRVNFAKKEVFIVFDNKQTTLKEVVISLASIGYEPHISLQNINTDKRKKINKGRIYRIGIAGFCFGNTMILCFPEYFSFVSSWDKDLGFTFNFLKIALSLPIVFYCANEFFINAWAGIKAKFLNIDVPLALAILLTFIRSLYEVLSQTGGGYFDSLAGLVFLMLVGRAVQDVTYQSISFDRDYKSFFPIAVEVQKKDKFEPVEINQIKINDIIRIHTHELIPVDAILSKGKAEIDYSFVTGESLPQVKDIGEIIYAGGKQMGSNIELVVVKEVSQSYLTSLWNKDAFHNKQKETAFLQILSQYFTYIVFAIATISATYWYINDDTSRMWNAITTILIVACPCALLLSSTFTNGNILRILSKNKFYLRHPDVIEDISKIKHIVLDKTGTLTESKKVEVNYIGETLNTKELKSIASLLAQSTHPLSNALFKHINLPATENIIDFKNHIGKGIEGKINGSFYQIGSAAFVQSNPLTNNNTSVFISIDHEIKGSYQIKNAYRDGLTTVITQLQKNYSLSILSGDNSAEAAYLQKILGKHSTLLFNQKPDEKLAYIAQLQKDLQEKVMMIGDGLNDAGALKQSHVGIAITETTNNFTPAADGILDAEQFKHLHHYLSFTKYGKKIMLSSFILSIIYNLIGIYFAAQGIMQPVIAAILMPASSVSIVLITWGMSELAAKRFKLS